MKLSIVIPVYNVERYIRKTLDSIFNQNISTSEFEVIIVNDGTRDNSMEIVKEFANQYSNITIANQENQGLSAARNKGIEISKADYIWFVDSDDWIAYNSIKRISNLLTEYKGTDVFLFKLAEYDEQGNILGEDKFRKDAIEKLSGIDYLLENIPYVTAPTFIYKRGFLTKNKLRFFTGIYHEDHEFMPRVMLKAKDVVIVPEVFYCYLRRNSGSITSSPLLYQKRKNSLLQIFDNYTDLLVECKTAKVRSALERKRIGILRCFWNDLTLSQWKTWKKGQGMSIRETEFKRCVWNVFFYKFTIKKALRYIFFLISPTLLKCLHKKL